MSFPPQPQPKLSCVEEVSAKLTEMVKFLKEHSHVEDSHVQGAERAASSLIAGLQNTIAHADALGASAKRVRLTHKQPTPEPVVPELVPAVSVRLTHKQPTRGPPTLADFGFKPIRARRATPVQEPYPAAAGGAEARL